MKLNRILMGAVAGLLMLAGAASALVVPQNFAPRLFPYQTTHYLRFVVNFNDCVLVSNTCSVKRGAVPYNSFITRAFTQTITAFNSGTLDDVMITTASGAWSGSPTTGGAAGGSSGAVLFTNAPPCNLTPNMGLNIPLSAVPTSEINGSFSGGATCLFTAHGQAVANGVQQLPLWNISAGINATGNGDTPTGGDGGFDIWSQYVQTSTAPTAGQAVFVIEYIAPNDGSCAPVALGSTATAC